MALPEIAAEMKANEENARLICEPPRKDPLSKDKVKEILIEKAKMEFESQQRVSQTQF